MEEKKSTAPLSADKFDRSPVGETFFQWFPPSVVYRIAWSLIAQPILLSIIWIDMRARFEVGGVTTVGINVGIRFALVVVGVLLARLMVAGCPQPDRRVSVLTSNIAREAVTKGRRAYERFALLKRAGVSPGMVLTLSIAFETHIYRYRSHKVFHNHGEDCPGEYSPNIFQAVKL